MPNEKQKKIRVKTKTVAKAQETPDEQEFFDKDLDVFEEVHSELKSAKSEPQELNPADFDYSQTWDEAKDDELEEAINAEFDRTYEGKRKKNPLYKKWYFWLAVAMALVALVLALLNWGTIDTSKPTDVSSIAEGATTAAATTEPYYETVTIKDFIAPSGSEVKKGPNGKWGLYDGNQLLTSYNGIASNEYGTWYVNNGYVDFGYTGYLVVNGTTYMVNKGKVDISAPVESPNTASTVAGADATTTTTEAALTDAGLNSAGTEAQQDALAVAVDYLNQMAFSRDWLIAQVEAEGYNHEDATWAADHSGANWNEQAYKKAQEYLTLTTFTRDDMLTQLEFEGFTKEQAAYGADKAGL